MNASSLAFAAIAMLALVSHGETAVSGNLLSQGCSIVASDQAKDSQAARFAVDGDRYGTRWARGGAADSRVRTLTLDLGRSCALDSVRVLWENLPAKVEILVSADSTAWTKVKTDMNPASSCHPEVGPYDGREESVRYKTTYKTATEQAEYRYVRLDMTPADGGNGKYWLSIWELEVFGCPAGEVVSYDESAAFKASSVATMTVNGKPVPVVAFLSNYDYAHFSFSGRATISLTVGNDIERATVSPLARGFETSVSGKTLTWTIDKSEYTIVKIDGYKEIIVAADDLETDVPPSSGDGVYNVVVGYGADATGSKCVKNAFQSAIDAAHAAGGGIVYFPPGLYRLTGNIVLKSNVHVYVSGGAVIRFAVERSGYRKCSYKSSLQKDVTWGFYNELGAKNFSIYGRGTIDGRGHEMLTSTNQLLNTMFYFRQADNVGLDGIVIRDGNFWTVEPKMCDGCSFTNLKIFNDFADMTENDAMDICESRDVTVRHVIAVSEDDTYSTKVYTFNGAMSGETSVKSDMRVANVLFEDCIGWTHCGTFKLGDGAYETHSNVVFRSCVSYRSAAAIKVSHAYGAAPFDDCVFEDIDIEGYEGRTLYGTRYFNGQWLWADRGAGSSGGAVNRLVLRNINIRDVGSSGSVLKGRGDAPIAGAVFENISVAGLDGYATTLGEMNITGVNSDISYSILPIDNHKSVTRYSLLAGDVRVSDFKYTPNALFAYTPETASAYIRERETARAMLADPDSTYDEMKAERTALANAASALVKRGTQALEDSLALNRSTYASGTQNSSSASKNAVDSSTGSCWRSQTGGAKPFWITVDLGSSVEFNLVTINWEDCYAHTYRLLVSDDNANWTPATVGGREWLHCYKKMEQYVYLDATVKARYLRVSAVEKPTGFGVGIYNLGVYNVDTGAGAELAGENLALGKNASASDYDSGNGYTPAKAVDGSLSSRWGRSPDEKTAPHWFRVDLGRSYRIDRVRVLWENMPQSVDLKVSQDGEAWVSVVSGYTPSNGMSVAVSGVGARQQTSLKFDAVSARYVQLDMTAVAGNGSYYLSMYELGVYKAAVSCEGIPARENVVVVANVPLCWLGAQGYNDSPVTAAEVSSLEEEIDSAGLNGIPVWQSYVAGLVPSDAGSRLEAFIEMEDGLPVVYWEPDYSLVPCPNDGLTRRYRVLGADTLGSGWGDADDTSRFFKVAVSIPK